MTLQSPGQQDKTTCSGRGLRRGTRTRESKTSYLLPTLGDLNAELQTTDI